MRAASALALAVGLAAQDPPPRSPANADDLFASSLSEWLFARRATATDERPASEVALRLRTARAELLAGWRLLGGDGVLADAERLRRVFGPAMVGVAPEGEDVPMPTGSLDPWLWISPVEPLRTGHDGYRVIVRLVPESEAWRTKDPFREGLLEPFPNLEALRGTAVVALRLPADFAFHDPLWNETRAGAEREAARVVALDAALRAALARIPGWDADRLVLDCERGTGAQGLRLLAQWNGRFAGALLREPEVVAGLRLEGIATPVGLVVDSLTREASEELFARLEEVASARPAGPRPTVRSFEGFEGRIAAYELPAYEAWLGGLAREREGRTHVVATPLPALLPPTVRVVVDALPEAAANGEDVRAEVVFDRTRNRIVVQSRGARALTLWLDDRDVDLDEAVTFVLDGVTVVERLRRDLWVVAERAALAWDPIDLATARITLALPRRD